MLLSGKMRQIIAKDMHDSSLANNYTFWCFLRYALSCSGERYLSAHGPIQQQHYLLLLHERLQSLIAFSDTESQISMLHRSVLLCDNRRVLFLGGRSNVWHLFRRMQLPCNCHAEKLLWVKTKVQKARKKRRLSAILPSRVSFCNFMQLMHRERPITYPPLAPYINSAVQCCAYVRFDAKIIHGPHV